MRATGKEPAEEFLTLRKKMKGACNMEDKKMFLYILTAALHMTRAGRDISVIDYIVDENQDEWAVISFDGGGKKRICVTADSCIAIMADIAKALM